MSHPVRVRGLKQGQMHQIDYMVKVAPRAGAWIETRYKGRTLLKTFVAPRAGAWIETSITTKSIRCRLMSHPVRVRGLKHKASGIKKANHQSHPVRVRGLKHTNDLAP